MSEYWKSTPSYWCKHCSTYVRDTKLEKTNHEATPRHQGNLKRFLRDLHRNNEKDQREKDRAKDEVARLNGLVTGSGAVASSSSASSSKGGAYAAPKPQVTAGQRKQQLAQLAEMGISIPDEFRGELAMAGDWQVTSERVIEGGDEESKPDALALGVRKRELDDEDEEAKEAKKSRWGTAIRTYPTEKDDGDLDALLSNATRKNKDPAAEQPKTESEVKIEVKEDPEAKDSENGHVEAPRPVEVKAEDSVAPEPSLSDIPPADGIKTESAELPVGGVVFKKRKAKNIRQK